MPADHDASTARAPTTRRRPRGLWPFIRLFLALYLPVAGAAGAIVYAVLQVQSTMHLADIRVREEGQVRIAAQLLSHDLQALTSDLLVLANSPAVRRFTESGSEADRARVADLFRTVSAQKGLYDQIRYLDITGMERVRVNFAPGHNPAVVPDAGLQSKAGRYYFRDTIRLAAGQVFVSPLDLNIEHDEIERPYKPIFRLGTPVFSRGGEVKSGVLILNVFGERLLDDFRHAMGEGRHALLLNRDGYYLSHPDREASWGFMFGRPPAFIADHPDAWRQLSVHDEGTFTTPAGLFTFATVHPLLAYHRSSTGSHLPVGASERQLRQEEYFWKVVSLVPPDELPHATLARRPRYLAGFIAALLLLALPTGFLAASLLSRRRLRDAVFDNETRLREIAATLGDGVYVLDAEGRITFANPEAERLLGWREAELLGKSGHDLFHHHTPSGEPVPETDCPVHRTIRTGEVYRALDDAFLRKDRSVLPVSIVSAPILRDGEVVGSVAAFQDITELKAHQEQIRQLAFYDTLTGLPNRRLFLDHFEQALTQAGRHRRSLAVMFLDLDRFKEVNDTLGHDAGDTLLKEVSARLIGCVRHGDTVSRQGGDEFVVVLSEIAHPQDAEQVACKIAGALRKPFLIQGNEVRISSSIGIAIYPVDGIDGTQDLMKKADIAMYAAKAAGRDRYHFYNGDGSIDPAT